MGLEWVSRQWSEPPGKREELWAEQRQLVMEALEVPDALRTVMLQADATAAEADDLVGGKPLVGGEPYFLADYEAAGKLHARRKMTVAGVEKRGLSKSRAYRIYRQYVAGAVVYDKTTGVRPGPGYQWDQSVRDDDPPNYKLIRR